MTAQPVPLGRARVDAITFEEAVQRILDLAGGRTARRYVVTPNIQHIALLARDREFADVYDGAALVLPDGFPVCVALRAVLGRPQPRVTGSDLLPAVCAAAAQQDLSVGFLGGRDGAPERTARRMSSEVPGLRVVLVEPASRGFEDSPSALGAVLDRVVQAQPDVLFVGLGSPKGEKFLSRNAQRLGTGVGLSVGAALDFQAGYVRRAPLSWQRLRLEWLWRIVQEPRRLVGRYAVAAPLFVVAVTPTVVTGLLRRLRH